MRTDPTLVRRLAGELDQRLRGERLTDAGRLDDGRAALVFARGGQTLVLDPFASTPIVFLDDRPLAIDADPGYLRAIATALRGMRLASVAAVSGERIITLDFAARSRFGVTDGYRLVVELIPRFGNIVLLRDGTIVAAAKQFGPADNQQRTILIGAPYALPPARPLRAPAPGAVEPESAEASLLEGLRECDAREREGQARSELVRTRDALHRRIGRRIASLRAERERLVVRRDTSLERDRLRAAGEALYAFSHLVPPRSDRFVAPSDPALVIELDPELDAKANAAAIFARYRKLVDAIPHVERRLEQVERVLAELEELDWQLETGDRTTLREISDLLGMPERAPRAARKARRARVLHYDLPSGARLYVGRSPAENAEVTFRIARPFDLWFHAREQPGAHVVLQTSSGRDAAPDDLAAAAAAAAFHSRARGAERVAIDYVARKYVRKQRDAPPGRVWYTNAQTLFVRPNDPASYAPSPA